MMRAAGFISLLFAIALGVFAIETYEQDSRQRDIAIDQLLLLLSDSPLRSSSLEEIGRFDGQIRNDEIVGGIAGVFFIGSLAILLQRE